MKRLLIANRGLITNNPASESSAIEPEGADKASRFMRLCNVHGLPILSLCDTPGFMVGPEVEERAHVRYCCQMFIQGANLKVPFFGVVLRKGYGLGAQSMLSMDNKRSGYHRRDSMAIRRFRIYRCMVIGIMPALAA